MTSKEKLLQLRHDFYNNEELNYDSIAYFTAIENDLEVLEILKGKILLISDLESTNDFEKVKGWLYDKQASDNNNQSI